MSGTNGASAPNDSGSPGEALPDGAIDGAIEAVESQEVDTAALARQANQEKAEMQARIRAQEERIAHLQQTSTRQSEMLSELVNRSRDAEGRGWAYEADRLRSVMRKAVADSDQATYDAAERDFIALMGRPPGAPPDQRRGQTQQNDQGNQQQQTQATDPSVVAWLNDNPWFQADKKLHRAAIAIEASIMEEKPYLSTADRLKEVRTEMAQRFPEKFGNQARSAPPAVARPGPQAAAKPKPKAKTLADLPEDAKLALARIKRRDPSFTDEDYIKSYQWDK